MKLFLNKLANYKITGIYIATLNVSSYRPTVLYCAQASAYMTKSERAATKYWIMDNCLDFF